ncbi:MAG: hypothetical protein ATN35_09475 [Epulopiscium sp. Nele67-Bin004]|nr:MAG: hypothetical protein ATN35_09475 [Epulopiscium sp. Nele67-Bin004]
MFDYLISMISSSAVSIITFMLFVVFYRLYHRITIRFISTLGKGVPDIIEEFNSALRTPLKYAWFITGAYCAVLVSPLINLSIFSRVWLTQLYQMLLVFCVTYGVYNTVSIYETILLNVGSKFTLLDNSLLIRFSVKVARFFIVVIGVGVAFGQFITNLDTILTGVGLGGVIFTVIAKDTLTNILNGVMLMVESRFL